MRVFAILLVLTVALPACSLFGLGASGVLFQTDAEVYAPGETVTARLEKRSGNDLGYNLCHTAVEVRREDWERASESFGRPQFCTDVMLVMSAGGSAETSFDLPPTLPAGDYRLRAIVYANGGRSEGVQVMVRFEVR